MTIRCKLGIHDWRGTAVPSIGAIDHSLVWVQGRTCTRCQRTQWVPWLGAGFIDIDAAENIRDVNRRLADKGKKGIDQ